MNVNSDAIREDYAHTVTYLNNASVSPMPQRSVREMNDFLEQYNDAGPDSPAADEIVTQLLKRTRNLVAGIIGCDPEEITMTQSVTDGINMVAGGIAVDAGSEIIIRGMRHEHHSNLYPWLRLGDRCKIRSLDVDMNGFFKMEQFERILSNRTALVSLSHALYNTGAILPVSETGSILSARNVPYFVDAAQSVGCIPVDVKKIGCDFMSFNGSKWLCGPMGTGIFYCKGGSETLLEPRAVGGESATYEDSLTYKEPPHRFQAGFRNYAGLAGLESSVRYLAGLGFDNVHDTITRLAGLLRDELEAAPGITVYGPADTDLRTSIVSFVVDAHECKYVVERLGRDGIILAVREIEDQKVVRASPHVFNTEDEMMQVVRIVRGL